jgi:hypothetical protein
MQKHPLIWLLILSCIGSNFSFNAPAFAQDKNEDISTTQQTAPPRQEGTLEKGKDIPSFELKEPEAGVLPSTTLPAGTKQYVLEFNRSPVVGNRFRLNGIYDEARLGFTRPRNWKIKSVKILMRYRQSGALYATRSNMTVRVNDTGVGSIPLTKRQDEIGTVVFDVPLHLIQDYNEITVAALQNNSPTCTQDPFDPSLWSEVMPDSKVVFTYEPQAAPLDFSRYPFPVFDELSLEGNQISYVLPSQITDSWLTSTTRLQTSLGRIADYRPLDTRTVKGIDEIKATEGAIVIGTPEQQPALKSLKLPLGVKDNKIQDEKQQPIADDTGVLMLTTTPTTKAPILVVTGNTEQAVAKAAQFLIQARDRKIGTGKTVLVKNVNQVPSPPAREWPGYLPLKEEFKLKDLKDYNNQPMKDVTVRGSDAPPVEFNFRSLPDDELQPGSSMVLRFSYGPQVNANTSLVEVQLDGVGIYGKRLTSMNGMMRDTLELELPPDKIKPNTKMQVRFRLDPRERRSCSRVTSQQLWATLHPDTEFRIRRTNAVQLPNLQLLSSAYPFASPQDLSTTAVVLPDSPSPADISTLLEFSKRIGRLSKADSVKLDVYTVGKLPKDLPKKRNLVGIGTQQKFPFPELFKAEGFQLGNLFSRQLDKSKVNTLPDNEGVIKQIVSPYSSDRILLALTSQTEKGLEQVQDFFKRDSLFFQLRGDTAVVSRNPEVISPDSPDAYNLEFFEREPKKRIERSDPLEWLFQLIRGNWFILAPGLIVSALILYGVAQLYLHRSAEKRKQQETAQTSETDKVTKD